MNTVVKLPITAKEFAAMQEDLIGRKLDEIEREICSKAVQIFTYAYAAGLAGTKSFLDDTEADISNYAPTVISEGPITENETQLFHSLLYWVNFFWLAGKKAAHAGETTSKRTSKQPANIHVFSRENETNLEQLAPTNNQQRNQQTTSKQNSGNRG